MKKELKENLLEAKEKLNDRIVIGAPLRLQFNEVEALHDLLLFIFDEEVV